MYFIYSNSFIQHIKLRSIFYNKLSFIIKNIETLYTKYRVHHIKINN